MSDEFYKCEVCTLWHRRGFDYRRDCTREIDGKIEHVEPPKPWV